MPSDSERFLSFFPYLEFKPQQLPVMEFVFDVVEHKEIGLVEAYCGFGKTIATLAPVFEQGKKVLLLSPTHLARNAGIAEALRQEARFSQGFLRKQKGFCLPRKHFSQGFLRKQKGFCLPRKHFSQGFFPQKKGFED